MHIAAQKPVRRAYRSCGNDGGAASDERPAITRAERTALDRIIALAYQRSRIRLDHGKEPLIRARLGKRMRALGYTSLVDYTEFLCSAEGVEEVGHAMDALTTNFTQFLRERDHFDFLVDEALPRLLDERQKRFQIWSAACATGEEPYTIAIYLEERYPLAEGWEWWIRATDISSRALDKAVRGIYAGERLGGLPAVWLHRHFQRGFGSCAGLYRVKRHLQERIAFEQVNLLNDRGYNRSFEIIFCRNVMIYFDRSTQEELVRHLTERLVPGGYLLTGRAESLGWVAGSLRCVRPSIYQKTN